MLELCAQLRIMAALGSVECVENLLNAGADVNAHGLQYRTALMLAAENGHAGVVSALLKAGASVNAVDQFGKTALSLAENANRFEVVTLLKAKIQQHEFEYAYLHKSLPATIIYPTVALASLGAIVAAVVFLMPSWSMALVVFASVFALVASEYTHKCSYDRYFLPSGVGLSS